jgi:hypothetical protein
MQKHSAIIGPSGAAIVIRFLDPEPATDPFRFGRIQTPRARPRKNIFIEPSDAKAST